MKIGAHKRARLFKQLYIRFQDDNVSALSAQLAFFLLLALFPFVLFLLNLISFATITSADFVENIAGFLPAEVETLFRDILPELLGAKSPGLLSIGALVTLWSASRGISAISFGLNMAYDKRETRPFFKVAAITLLFTLGIAVMVLAALLFLIFGEVLARDVFSCLDGAEAFTQLWRILRYIVPLAIMLFVFSLLFKFVPNCRLRFKHVLPGALLAAIGWAAVSVIFSFYVNNFASYTRIYGSIGGIIILLLWLYISSLVVLLGGEVNAALEYFRSGQKLDKYENPHIKLPQPFRKKKPQ